MFAYNKKDGQRPEAWMTMNFPVVTLMATVPRIDALLKISLPSIKAQIQQPEHLVLVADSRPFTEIEQQHIVDLLPNIPVTFLMNLYSSGAAGSWNTGIKFINSIFTTCYVAILDDDDHWTERHLQICGEYAVSTSADIVLSGINVVNNGKILTTNYPKGVTATDFLTGNPGWQGSNTFARLDMLYRAGKFSDGLVSCNDRDLAIRVLDLMPSIAYTQSASVFWHVNEREDALSAKRSIQKLVGSAQFFRKYHQRMSSMQKDAFFRRTEMLFNWTRTEIEKEIGNFHFEKQYFAAKNSANAFNKTSSSNQNI